MLHKNLEGYVLRLRIIVRDQIGDANSEHLPLGISEFKWTRVGDFSSYDHYIYYSGQEALGRGGNGVAIIVNKESEIQYLEAISKMTE